MILGMSAQSSTQALAPDVTTESGITTPSFILDIDCTSTENGEYYVVNVNVTINGIQCQHWDEQSPHSHNK